VEFEHVARKIVEFRQEFIGFPFRQSGLVDEPIEKFLGD